MLVDVSGSSRDALRRSFDLCVVGGGPAGVTVARTAAGAGLSVGLMEGGGLDFSQASQDLYAGEVIGRDYFPLDATRLRYFGGTSNHWGGRCRPLEESDFKPHGFYPLSGWPISKADLDPYAKETDSILDLPSLDAEHADNSLGRGSAPCTVPDEVRPRGLAQSTARNWKARNRSLSPSTLIWSTWSSTRR